MENPFEGMSGIIHDDVPAVWLENTPVWAARLVNGMEKATGPPGEG